MLITGISQDGRVVAHGPAETRPDGAPLSERTRVLYASPPAELGGEGGDGTPDLRIRWLLLDSGHELHDIAFSVRLRPEAGMSHQEVAAAAARLRAQAAAHFGELDGTDSCG